MVLGSSPVAVTFHFSLVGFPDFSELSFFLSTNCGIVKTFTIVACLCFWTISTDMTLIQTWKTTIAFWRVSLRWWVLTKNHNCCFRYLNLVNYTHAIGYCQNIYAIQLNPCLMYFSSTSIIHSYGLRLLVAGCHINFSINLELYQNFRW